LVSTIEKIKQLREETAAGMMDVKNALEESGGDLEGARRVLRERGQALAAKKSSREASEGLVDAYIHFNGRVGVLVEVNCETDFVARTDKFTSFVHEVALHVAATRPQFLSVDDVPEELKASERAIFAEQSKDIPEAARERAIEGRLAKHLKSLCLLEQEYVRDQGAKRPRTIEELRAETASDLKENVTIRRFTVFELGR
jgi:elongation factor Ts